MRIRLSPDLYLAPLNRRSAPTLVRYLGGSPVYREQTRRIPFPYTRDHARRFITAVRHAKPRLTAPSHWGIYAVKKGLLGVLSLTKFGRHTLEMGFWLGKPHWGKGVMSRVVQAAVRILERRKIAKSLLIRCRSTNTASRKIARKCGFLYWKERDLIFRPGGPPCRVSYYRRSGTS